MFYLMLAIISSVLVSIFMRISESYSKNEMSMFMANYAVCMILSLIHMYQGIPTFDITSSVLGIISGILYLGSFLLLKWNITYNGVVLSSTFMKLGVLIPTLMAILIFHET